MAVIDEVAKHHIIQAEFQVSHFQISINGGVSPQRKTTLETIGRRGKGIVLAIPIKEIKTS